MFRPICVEQGISDPLIKGIKEIITKEMKFSGQLIHGVFLCSKHLHK